MDSEQTRRWFLRGSVTAGAVALAGCTGEDDDAEPATDDTETDDTETDDTETDDTDDENDEELERTYEVWAADQGRDVIHLYEPADGEDGFEEVETIDIAADADGAPENFVPHMVDFTTDYEYAAIPCTAGGRVLVYRTEDRELVGEIETGPASHFASFSPDNEYLTVDVIGEERIVKVDATLEAGNESFEEVDEIVTDETVEGLTEEEGSPVCHQFDGNGRSIHTLGPSYHGGGLVIVDHDDFSVDTAFPGEELPTNCGTVPHPAEDKFYLTAGLPTPTDDDGEPIEGEEGVGDYYILDTEDGNNEVIDQGETGGIDAHGFWFTPDGEELWVLNRETNDGIILDPDTDEVIDEIDAYGPEQSADPSESDAPDIMWASPDGQYMFVTLRGPNPQSGDPHAATGINPGFAVFDIESRERVDTIIPSGEDDSDFHGIGVRPVGDWDGFTSPVY